MSKKIINNLLAYALQNGARQLVISRSPQQIFLDYYLPAGESRRLSLPKKLEHDFFDSLNRVLEISAGELLTKKYHKIAHRHSYLPAYLSVLPDQDSEKIIISLIERRPEAWRLNQLGFRTEDLKTLKKILSRRSGLIMVSSPPSGGKTTTLRALAESLDRAESSLYFLSLDPPALPPGINVLSPTAANWEKLRRLDSEIIFADNLNQDWAIAEALATAATGRLVVAAFSAATKIEVVRRLKNLKNSHLLADLPLKIIISQSLSDLARPARVSQSSARRIIGRYNISRL